VSYWITAIFIWEKKVNTRGFSKNEFGLHNTTIVMHEQAKICGVGNQVFSPGTRSQSLLLLMETCCTCFSFITLGTFISISHESHCVAHIEDKNTLKLVTIKFQNSFWERLVRETPSSVSIPPVRLFYLFEIVNK